MDPQLEAAYDVITRNVGPVDNLTLEIVDKEDGRDCYEISASEGRLLIKGSSPSALCYAFNKYLRNACGSMVSWGGQHLDIPVQWPDFNETSVSPYQFRYFLNV